MSPLGRRQTVGLLGLLVAGGAILPAVLARQDPPEAPPTEAPAESPAEEAVDELADVYFAICDYNSDGAITLKEAQQSLGLDRDGFRPYDSLDRDGQITLAEFRERYRRIVERGGVFPPPVAKPSAFKKKERTPAELIEAFDLSLDDALSERELTAVIAEYGVTNLSPETALEKLDKDRSGDLEEDEIEELLTVLDPTRAKRASEPKATSILELFGRAQEREVRPGSTPLPPRIVGPVPAFRRLDLDGDGTVSMDDLIELQRPIQLPVRVNALMATLDVDQDGVIDEAEFWASMSPARR